MIFINFAAALVCTGAVVLFLTTKEMKNITILAIESSCDDTSAAVIRDGILLSNVMAGQKVHEEYGGVVPELASRAHQQNIVPVVDLAIKKAGISKDEISAVAFTRGPGLLGSLLVGVTFAKAFALAYDIPLIDVNHIHGHILSHFIREPEDDRPLPNFPFLTLVVSGGHTQIVRVDDYFDVEILGETIDDAAGEAFDKCAKVMGLGYPGGPVIDRLAKEGNPNAFKFPIPKAKGLNFSYSGLKTSFLYFLRDRVKENPDFIEQNKEDLAASLQKTIIDSLLKKLEQAVKETGIKEVAIGGGVSANSELRERITELGKQKGWTVHVPPRKFTTDNAGMIGIIGYYKYLKGEFVDQSITPMARMKV